MTEARHEVLEYIQEIAFPVTKEELINGILAASGPGRMIALVERLPRDRYETEAELRPDLEEVSRVHAEEVTAARTYDDYLAVVLRHVGDIRHATKETYNNVVQHIVHTAEQQGQLDHIQARSMTIRLDAAFADLRRSMSEVYDESVPTDPTADLPHERR